MPGFSAFSGVRWHLEAMTETTEPNADGGPQPADEKRSVWGRLNRVNRIAAVVLGGLIAVVVAVLTFGAGLFIGAEYGDSEGHREGAGASEYADTEADSGVDNEADNGGDQAQSGDHGRSEAPEGPAPGEPRP
ncbi:hypothetical protein DVS77_10785 [Mycolicibacterium moriokaense]|nr:hypothetical protein DVS77_10785 [Mycolicibacterium moriokaense]